MNKKFANSGPKGTTKVVDETPFAESVATTDVMPSLVGTPAPPAPTPTTSRYWVTLSDNVAAFAAFDPKVTYTVTNTVEQEAAVAGTFTFEITKAEYDKRNPTDA